MEQILTISDKEERFQFSFGLSNIFTIKFLLNILDTFKL
jgi:hypothetical protein